MNTTHNNYKNKDENTGDNNLPVPLPSTTIPPSFVNSNSEMEISSQSGNNRENLHPFLSVNAEIAQNELNNTDFNDLKLNLQTNNDGMDISPFNFVQYFHTSQSLEERNFAHENPEENVNLTELLETGNAEGDAVELARLGRNGTSQNQVGEDADIVNLSGQMKTTSINDTDGNNDLDNNVTTVM